MFGKSKQKKASKEIKMKAEQKSLLPSTDTDAKLKELEAEIELENNENSYGIPVSSDNKNKVVRKISFGQFVFLLVCVVVLSKLPFSEIIFTPLNQFSTMIHELSHAIVCILTGGWVSGMTIVPDGQGHGGLTLCHGGIPFLYYQAGYLGSAVVGCFLVFLGLYKHLAKSTLTVVGIITTICSLIFMGAGLISPLFFQVSMSLIWAVFLSSALIWAGMRLDEHKANLALMFLAINTSLDSLSAIGIVIGNILFSTGIKSDATAMAQIFFLPAIFWSFLWAFLSIGMIGLTLWFCFREGGKKSITRVE